MDVHLEQLSQAFESLPAAVLVVDDDGIIIAANPDLDAMFGYEAGELLGDSVEVLVPRDVREQHPQLRQAYRGLPSRRQVATSRGLFGLTKSGDRIPIDVGLNRMESGSDHVTIALVVDRTATVAEQERTRAAINAAGSAMILANDGGSIVMTNRAADHMFGVEPGKLLGSNIESLIPERIRHRHRVFRASYIMEPSVRAMGAGRDLHGLRADGTEFPVEVGLTPFDDGGESMVMATVVDITERMRSESEIHRQNEDLRNLNDDLTQFAYSASHDLKAPLTTLQGILQILRDDVTAGDYEEVAINAGRAQGLASRLADLIESTLGLAHSAGYETTDLTPVHLHGLVDHVGQSLQGLFVANDATLRNRVPTDCRILTQRIRVRQIIDNLLSNGAKYADPAKGHRHVEVSVEELPGEVKLVISDNGVGIPDHAGDQIFKRFQRFGRSEIDGNGIGLALAKQHVDRLSGEISYQSSPEGTRFEVVLPNARPSNWPETERVE